MQEDPPDGIGIEDGGEETALAAALAEEHSDVEQYVLGTVAEGALELVEHLAVGSERQPLVHDGRAGCVAAELLQALGRAGGDADGSMEREAVDGGAQRLAVKLAPGL